MLTRSRGRRPAPPHARVRREQGWRIVLLASALLGCAAPAARPGPPPAAPAEPASALPRSSIAAVLERREELELSAAEVTRLRELDDELARTRAALKAQHRRRPPEAREREHPAARPDGGGGPGGGGRAPGGPGMRGPGQGRDPEGGRGARESRSGADSGDELLMALDDADTRAYLEAEAALDPAHRDRAREIAASYREALYDQRARRKEPRPAG